MSAFLKNRNARAFLLLAVIALALGILGGPQIFSGRTMFSILQQFAVLGPVALALGLTMVIRHFDLSVAGMLGLAGCIAVLCGAGNPLFGIALAVGFGAVFGALQGAIITTLRLSSIGVTLGGLLILNGLAYVITGNRELGYPRPDVAQFVDATLGDVLSFRALVAIAIFAVIGLVMSRTRLGRDIIASGSDPAAAAIAGVPVKSITILVMTFSGAAAALAGGLLSFSLTTASPTALADVLVPAAAAAIIGGVSLSGGRGHPMGIAGGVLVLCLLRSGLSALNVEPYVHGITVGFVLAMVGLLDSTDLERRLINLRRAFARPRPS